MKAAKLSRLVWLAVLAMAIPTFSLAQDKKDSPPGPRGESQPKAATTTATVPIYKPPLRGAPGGRVGGGTRGSGREVFVLTVLAPDHSALTVSEQPAISSDVTYDPSRQRAANSLRPARMRRAALHIR